MHWSLGFNSLSVFMPCFMELYMHASIVGTNILGLMLYNQLGDQPINDLNVTEYR